MGFYQKKFKYNHIQMLPLVLASKNKIKPDSRLRNRFKDYVMFDMPNLAHIFLCGATFPI